MYQKYLYKILTYFCMDNKALSQPGDATAEGASQKGIK
jgi:hypothetical protein